MKYWIIIVVFLLGYSITIVGAMLRVMHWPWGSEMIVSGSLAEALAVLLLAIKVIINRKSNSFLNS
ncbi:gliding motility protein GldL [Flavobacterium alkalisoli]|uniref:Gliding motility protein GldL n=1 Tax=Flavobacterium alkalisoli TaxID=2602769 RepID=A0A5B9FZY5_9FLAO|nr:gliding motility protein GldL [Flavobacterium alkalisoli]QEE50357.1 gliding motility protein GldL [Flavobacterium alkalisoli]